MFASDRAATAEPEAAGWARTTHAQAHARAPTPQPALPPIIPQPYFTR